MGLLRRAGGEAVPFPTLEIQPVAVDAAQLLALAACDTAIYVSANAVKHGHGLLPESDLAGKRLAAIGPATRQALQQRGCGRIEYPGDQSSSEDLLRLPLFQDIAGQRIAIVRGRGGRDALKQALVERGARVFYVDCYERRMPAGYDPGVVCRELARDDTTFIISVTSVAGLSNLVAMVARDWRPDLLSRPLVVIGERQQAAALALGWSGTILATTAADERIVETITDWHHRRVNTM